MPRNKTTFPKGNGAGWGGGKKGEGTKARFHAGDEHRGAHNAENVQAAIADREEVLALYTEIVRDKGETASNRINAGDKLLDRIEGKAIAREIVANVDDVTSLSDAELHAELARLEREAAEAAARGSEESAGKPAGSVPAVH